jgi:tetratricopeptide (TPR) repeat protein
MDSEFKAQELLERGVKLLESNHHKDALRNLKRAYQIDADSTRCLSYLGLALALAEKRFKEGEELCQLAIRKEFFHPAYYLNLGRLYLASGSKRRAIWAFRKGLDVDRSDASLGDAMAALGKRSRPPIAFLPRTHVVNRTLGKIRHSVAPRGRRKDGAATAPGNGAALVHAPRKP